MNTKYFYVRDANYFPVTCVATTEVNGQIAYAWTTWNPKDKYSKQRAREIAEGRLKKALEFKAKLNTVQAGPDTQHRILLRLLEIQNNPSKLLREAISDNLWSIMNHEAGLQRKQRMEENDSYVRTTRVSVPAKLHERDVPVGRVERRATGDCCLGSTI